MERGARAMGSDMNEYEARLRRLRCDLVELAYDQASAESADRERGGLPDEVLFHSQVYLIANRYAERLKNEVSQEVGEYLGDDATVAKRRWSDLKIGDVILIAGRAMTVVKEDGPSIFDPDCQTLVLSDGTFAPLGSYRAADDDEFEVVLRRS